MYTMLLMASMTLPATAPDFHFFGSRYGCGCSNCYRACSCAGCFGCGGRACSGCGCHGWGCGCYGCAANACCGCSGCASFAGCYGGAYGGCYGCAACSCSGCYGSVSFVSCYGCHGCYGCYGAGFGCAGASCPGGIAMAPVSETRTVAWTDDAPVSANQAAKLIVKLPADAKLYVDSYLTKTSSQATRVFNTPVLAAGQDYVYTLRAEVERDGKTITTSKRVVVRAGAEVETRLEMPEAGTATASR